MVREWMQMEDCMIDTKNSLPKIYLSGPMRGVEYHNRPKFDKWEKVFIDGGEFEPVNPVKIGDGIASQQDMENDDELMQKVFDADIAELSNCDAIFMMRGWENSEGARKELRHALENGKKVLLESELSAKMEAYDVKTDITNAICDAACSAARDLSATAIITVSKSGQTARNISKFRPSQPIVCATPEIKSYHQLSLSWGVFPVLARYQKDYDTLMLHAVDCAKQIDLVEAGDVAVIVAGVPLGFTGNTNLIKIENII